MSNPTLFQRVLVGLKKRPLKFLLSTFISYSVIWTLLEPLISFIPSFGNQISESLKFSLLIGAMRNAAPSELKIKYDNSIIKIKFSDLFLTEGFRVIPVSRFFFEIQVVQTSLQGILIKKIYR
jgi:hypothetical protein